MTGDEIVGTLLREFAPLADLVVPDSIKVGALPDNVVLPALLAKVESSIDFQPLRPAATERVTDRVSVTVRATSHRERRAVIKLVRKCCRGMTGDIGGGFNVAITTAGQGPDLSGPANSYEKTQDFRVSFDDLT